MLQAHQKFWQQIIAAFFALFFSGYNFYLSNTVITLLLFMAAISFSFAAWYSWRGTPVESINVFAWCVCVYCVLYGAHENGFSGFFFIFPVVVALFFIFSVRAAVLMLSAMLSVTMFLASEYLAEDVAIRMVGAIVLTALLSMLNAILIEKQNQHLQHQADTDALTSAFNRHAFHVQVQSSIIDFHRYKQQSTMLMIDADWFKAINDKYGHLVGDKVLCELVNLLQLRLRKNDQLFRYGGEEFAVLLPHLGNEDGGKVAESIRSLVEKYVFSHDISLTISIGVAAIRQGDDMNSWVGRADSRLYLAKKQRNNVVNKSVVDVEASIQAK